MTVKRLYTVLAFVLMVCWAPITAHCSLEKLPGLEFLQCATDSPAGGDCEGDSCSTVESGFYKTQDHPELLVSPGLFVVSFLPLPIKEVSLDFFSAAALTVAPPEMPQSWRFAQRAVLPVRAPSHL